MFLKKVIDSWFQTVKTFLENLNLLSATDLACRLWNTDETGFCTSASSAKVLARKGSKDVYETSGGSGRQYYTVLAAGAADGTRLPPFLLYKGVNLYLRWTQGGPAGAVYGMSDSGWMEESNFFEWFRKLFVPATRHLTSTGPVILFVDGHYSHITYNVVACAKEKGIHLLCFPPHLTHILQPLDVGVYGPVKKTWKAILKEHRLATLAQNVTKEDFPGESHLLSKKCLVCYSKYNRT